MRRRRNIDSLIHCCWCFVVCVRYHTQWSISLILIAWIFFLSFVASLLLLSHTIFIKNRVLIEIMLSDDIRDALLHQYHVNQCFSISITWFCMHQQHHNQPFCFHWIIFDLRHLVKVCVCLCLRCVSERYWACWLFLNCCHYIHLVA